MLILRGSYIVLLSWLVIGCSTSPAPVIDRTPVSKSTPVNKSGIAVQTSPATKTSNGKISSDWRPDTHTVKKGDTLFSIGLEYGYDYKDIAQANNINAPYIIKVGQVLNLSGLKDKADTTESVATSEQENGVITYPINTDATNTKPIASTVTSAPIVIAISEPKATREPYSEAAFKAPLPTPAKPAAVATTVAKTNTDVKATPQAKTETKPDNKINTDTAGNLNWTWPTKGKVISGFNDGGNKGIDITGTKGQPIVAAAPGKVIYSGSDLRGYGKLVIVKHNNNYLSVYANNNSILVKEGQLVSAGQKIAEMGDTDSNLVKLHFEIRQQGKSVDPAKFLASN